MSYDYTKSLTNTPQSSPIPGRKMKKNAAGGYVFQLDAWDYLDRFLILGSESNTYYASSSKLTAQNAENILRLISSDGVKVVDRVVEVSDQGLAPKNDPALFVLALCVRNGSEVTRKAAYDALPKVARIGTHLYTFVDYATKLGNTKGWGRGLRRAVANWYNNKDPQSLQYQIVKYKQRNGWSHKDLLRLSHAVPKTDLHNEIFQYVTKGTSQAVFESTGEDALWLIWAAEEAKGAESVSQVVKLIKEHNLPREVIPTQFLNDPKVWEALLEKMPMTALLRNLGNMSKVGLLTPLSNAARDVVSKLNNEEALRKARVHPMAVLVAMNTYNMGRSVRGDGVWTPVGNVVDALDGAFYKTFKNVEPTNKRTMLALDVSGSMGCGTIAGMPGITPRVGSAAMSLVTANVELNHMFVAFTSGGRSWSSPAAIRELTISPRDRLDRVISAVSHLPFGGTDCSLPILHAMKNKIPVDTFVIYTDNETWAGHTHTTQALNQYRQRTGIPAKLVAVGMTATDSTLIDPQDSGQLSVVGFDASAPKIISDFSRD